MFSMLFAIFQNIGFLLRWSCVLCSEFAFCHNGYLSEKSDGKKCTIETNAPQTSPRGPVFQKKWPPFFWLGNVDFSENFRFSEKMTMIKTCGEHQCVTRPKIWTIPIPRLFLVPNFFETNSETFFGTKIFWDRFRDFFRYSFFSRPVPRLFSVPNFFDSGSDTIKKNEEFPGTGIPGTGTSHSGRQVGS